MATTMTLTVKANRDVERDTLVNVRLDTEALWRNEVTLYFENGDYCDVNVRKFYQVGRYLSTYLNVHAVEVFIEDLGAGRIRVEAR